VDEIKRIELENAWGGERRLVAQRLLPGMVGERVNTPLS
jgi:hypothetical protein